MAVHADLLSSLLIGLAAGGFVFAGVARAARDYSTRKALAIASLSVGALITWFLYKNPGKLLQIANTVTERGVLTILAALAAALAFWRMHS